MEILINNHLTRLSWICFEDLKDTKVKSIFDKPFEPVRGGTAHQ